MKILLLITFMLFPYLSYASNWDTNNVTIRELKEKVIKLQKSKKELKEKWDNFNWKYWNFSLLLKKWLKNSDLKYIIKVLNDYKEIKTQYNKELRIESEKWNDTTELRAKFVKEKKRFFYKLRYFIKKDKIWEFIDYVEDNLELIKVDKQLKDDIIRENFKLNTKINRIRNSINRNYKILNEKLEKIITEKINNKIKEISSWKTFMSLSNEWKIDFFKNIAKKIETLNKWKDQIEINETNIQKNINEITYRLLKEIIWNKIKELTNS